MYRAVISSPRRDLQLLAVSTVLALLLSMIAPALGVHGNPLAVVAPLATPPPLSAQSAILVNTDTGEVLWGLN